MFWRLRRAIRRARRRREQRLRRAETARQQEVLGRFRAAVAELPNERGVAFFVKVGANDGITGDPCSDLFLSDPRWRGVLVEPVEYCLRALRKNFGGRERFAIEPLAISDVPGRRTFFEVDERAVEKLPDLPVWWDQLGSFDRSIITGYFDGALEPHIVERQVEVQTLEQLLARHDLPALDLLHVDAEGHDLEVLRSLRLAAWSPRVIYIEHLHLGPEARREMLGMLGACGYLVEDCGRDFYARC